MRAKPRVVLGFLGTVLDQGRSPARWERWRPTISLCQHAELPLHRIELLCERSLSLLVDTLISDVASLSPATELRPHVLDIPNPWDFETVYGALHDFARQYPWAPEREE